MIEKKEKIEIKANETQEDTPETRMLASIQQLEMFVTTTSKDIFLHVKTLKENNQILQSTAYNMAKIPAEIQDSTRAATKEEYAAILPRIREDFQEDGRELVSQLSEKTKNLEKTIEKGLALHRLVFRNLIVVAVVAGIVSIGGTWGALKLFKPHTSISTAQNVTSSGPIHIFDVSGRHISSVLENKKK